MRKNACISSVSLLCHTHSHTQRKKEREREEEEVEEEEEGKRCVAVSLSGHMMFRSIE